MDDQCEQFVAAVHAKLKTIRGNVEVKRPSKVGAKYWKEHNKPELVRWARGSRAHEETTSAGGDATVIFAKKQTLLVQVWASDEAACDALVDDVIRAATFAAGGVANLSPGVFTWVTEDHPGYASLGAMMMGTLVVKLDLTKSNKQVVRVTITEQSHTETLDP